MKEEAPAPQGGAPEQGGEGGGDPTEAITGIATTVNDGLEMLSQVFEKLGNIPPEAKKKFAAVAQGFQQVMGEIMGGGGAPQGAAPEGAVAPQEAGGSAGAVPAGQNRY